jgi:hypothetical protein
VNETKSHLAIGKKEFVDGDGKGLAGADDQGRKYERIANARAITAMSPPIRREPFIAALPWLSGVRSSSFYTPRRP